METVPPRERSQIQPATRDLITLDPNIYLANSDSYGYFSSTGEAIITGPTGNNVRDLRILIGEACSTGFSRNPLTQHAELLFVRSAMKIITVSALFVLLLFVQDVSAQQKLSPNQPVVRDIEPGKTHSYSISLNDGDYVSNSITQHGKVDVTIFSPDGSRLRRFLGPSAMRRGNLHLSLKAPVCIRSVLRTRKDKLPNTS